MPVTNMYKRELLGQKILKVPPPEICDQHFPMPKPPRQPDICDSASGADDE